MKKLESPGAVAALCILAACGTGEPPRIPYAGGDAGTMQAAFAECRQQAMMTASAVQDLGERSARERSLERDCMERRGYTRR